MVIISEQFTGCAINRHYFAECVNDINYNANCVTLSEFNGSNFVRNITS